MGLVLRIVEAFRVSEAVTSDQVRQIAHQRDQEEVQQVHAEHQEQNLGGVLVHHQLQVGNRKGYIRVVKDVLGKPCPDSDQHRTSVMAQYFDHTQLLLLVLRLGFFEDRRVVNAGANLNDSL